MATAIPSDYSPGYGGFYKKSDNSGPYSIDSAGNASQIAYGGGYRSQVTITRPANVTAYAAGDVLGGAFEIPTIGPSGGQLMITSVDLAAYITATPAGMTSFRMYLYSATPPSAIADNGAWDLPSGDRSVFVGFVDIPSMADIGSTVFAQIDAVNKQCKTGTGSTSLFAYLVTNGGFTPAANSEVYVATVYSVVL